MSIKPINPGGEDDQDNQDVPFPSPPFLRSHQLVGEGYNGAKRPNRPNRPGLRLPAKVITTPASPGLFDRPPWHVVSSLELAAALGISLQTVANWRIRNVGPAPMAKGLFRGNRSYYCVETVLEWLSSLQGRPRDGWTFSRDFLLQIFPSMATATEAEVRALITTLEDGKVFPHRWVSTRQKSWNVYCTNNIHV
jgi:hypothetical protein